MFLRIDNMIRTQVSFDKEEYILAKKAAKAQGVSVAYFLRLALRDKLPASESAPWMRYAGMVESGNSQSSQTIDDIVYGSKD